MFTIKNTDNSNNNKTLCLQWYTQTDIHVGMHNI